MNEILWIWAVGWGAVLMTVGAISLAVRVGWRYCGTWGAIIFGIIVSLVAIPHCAYILHISTGGDRLIILQTIVLMLTLVGVGWYAWEARRTAQAAEKQTRTTSHQVEVMTAQFEIAKGQFEVMKRQFDVEYTPHLRPEVCGPDPDGKFVIIRLSNLSGTGAVHPGVHPKWLPRERNAPLVKEPDDNLHEGDFFTCMVIKVDETWRCRVRMPGSGECKKVGVEWDEEPWGERNTHIWRFERIPGTEKEWHFHYYAEDNKPSP